MVEDRHKTKSNGKEKRVRPGTFSQATNVLSSHTQSHEINAILNFVISFGFYDSYVQTQEPAYKKDRKEQNQIEAKRNVQDECRERKAAAVILVPKVVASH